MARTPLGALRDVVTIQQQAETTTGDQQGGAAISWSTVATAAALIAAVAQSGREFRSAGAVGSHVQYLVEIPYRANVTPAMRLRWTPYLGSAKTLEILAAYPKDGGRERLMLECAEVAA